MNAASYSGSGLASAATVEDVVKPDTIAAILAQLKEQDVRIGRLEAAVERSAINRTHFDILTMAGVTADFVCDEISFHNRSTVEFNALPCKVTLDYPCGELSILLDDADSDLSFLGVTLRVDCITDCHLLVDPDNCSVVVDTNTSKITDVTQLVLVGPTQEATRELYEALRDVVAQRRPPCSPAPDTATTTTRNSSRALINRSEGEYESTLGGDGKLFSIEATPNNAGTTRNNVDASSSPRLQLSNTLPCDRTAHTPVDPRRPNTLPSFSANRKGTQQE
ncbi:hypothetical protein, conserved [Trypanosoma brucei gambiense DAL972]|uniref:Uncharacterized protein n=2 Tax=Trypanosoma brucei TaxID=5691 RepID=C9ZTT8_TRYB9|nr:hypothetical protein, conserved [Trypanosoma brucei gambiense DAL972]RHW71203.1 hypothetical protein DPX39_070072100 [Trypanosoma brucei equiperdum]CBH12824.1 hypothetical protein, conserved [Trypanosoma brucei gambiense DAL972]|eukprot:XP_011775103.1 hypothetical protein, conserved [Trypanosoma brucei gambiense DAL972]